MTPNDPIACLEAYGYTPRQAAFLRLVLLFGGYFVRRRVMTFFGGGDGGVTTDFVRTLVARGHATCGTYRRKTQVVHVFAKRLYAALGEPDNRNRRTVEPASILRKLLTLDLVLAHRREHFLATTREKVAYFEGAGLPRRVLPATRYQARRQPGPPTLRYFVDKAPIWVSDDWHRVVFAFVRTPIEGMDHLRTRVTAYAPLLAWLPEPTVLVVATTEADARESVAVATAALRVTPTLAPATVEERRARVERYFEARHRLDLADPACLSPDEVAQLRAMRTHFPDRVYESLYVAYLTVGPAVLYNPPPVPTVPYLTHVTVTPEVIPVHYELYGTQHRCRSGVSWPGNIPRIGQIDVSSGSAALSTREIVALSDAPWAAEAWFLRLV